MVDITQANSEQIWITPRESDPVAVSDRYTYYIWPSALVIFGLFGTFAWITFLGWCVLCLIF